jgi:hypothetical protein
MAIKKDLMNDPVAKICKDMIDWEDDGEGSTSHFTQLLAPAFRFRRADGSVVNKSEFIANLPKGANGDRSLVGKVECMEHESLAVASLCVRFKGNLYRNIRVFKRDGAEGFQLLMWCNHAI